MPKPLSWYQIELPPASHWLTFFSFAVNGAMNCALMSGGAIFAVVADEHLGVAVGEAEGNRVLVRVGRQRTAVAAARCVRRVQDGHVPAREREVPVRADGAPRLAAVRRLVDLLEPDVEVIRIR